MNMTLIAQYSEIFQDFIGFIFHVLIIDILSWYSYSWYETWLCNLIDRGTFYFIIY